MIQMNRQIQMRPPLGNGTATLNYAYHPGTDQIASRSWQIGQNTPFLNMDNSFDDYSRLIEISANSVAEIAYTLNDDNQRTAAALNDGSAWAYGYDTKGQLLTAVREDSQNTTLNGMTYDYDGIGNRTEAEEDTVAKEYVSNLLNQYTFIETTSEPPPITESPTYDADGNMLTNGPWTYTWNTESRLTTAASGTTVLEFQYDYMGRRIEKKVTENSVVTKQENYVYDGYKLIAIYDALDSNALIMTFVWQPIGLDVPLCMTYNGNTYYYLTDGNKNVTGLFDSTGARVATYLYGPFGQILSSTGTMASINPLRFSSEFHDDETALVYYNYRYYSSVLGRWTRRDPIGEEEGGANLYGVEQNMFINSFDILGLWILNSNADKNSPRRLYISTLPSDTIETLAKKVNLDSQEFSKWGKIVSGTKENPCIVSVPNIVHILDLIGYPMWNSWQFGEERILREQGFMVIEHNDPDYSSAINIFAQDDIYGVIIIAHGDRDKKGGFLASDDRVVFPSSISVKYKLGGLKIIVCYAKTKESEWKKLVYGYFYPGKEGYIFTIGASWMHHGF